MNTPTDLPQPGTSMPAPSLTDSCYVNTMIHFYRGELGRIMVWRQRLDVTTNWAITSTTTIVTLAFSVRSIPHLVFFFNLIIVLIMLWIEARRFRFYDAFRGRVRMLEVHFIVPMLTQNTKLLDGEWRRLVSQDLIIPSFKIGKTESVCRRLKRNYIYLFVIIMVAWTLKLFMDEPAATPSFRAFYQAFAVQSLPSWFGCGLYVCTIIMMAAGLFYVLRFSWAEVSELHDEDLHRWRL